MAGWLGVAGWLVGKSDFNENQVVYPDLDLGLRLRVCQYQIGKWKTFCLDVEMGLFALQVLLVRSSFVTL